MHIGSDLYTQRHVEKQSYFLHVKKKWNFQFFSVLMIEKNKEIATQ